MNALAEYLDALSTRFDQGEAIDWQREHVRLEFLATKESLRYSAEAIQRVKEADDQLSTAGTN